MKWLKMELPEKLFGLDTSIIVVFVPTFMVLILAILSFGWVATPRIDDFNKVTSKISNVKQKTTELNTKINYLKSVDLQQLVDNQKLVNNALLPQKNAYLLVNVVRKISEKYGFSVDSFNVSLQDLKTEEGGAKKVTSINKTGFSTVPLSVVLVGPASSYIDIISAIEQSLPLMSLDQFKLKNSGMMVELDLKIAAYYSEERSKVDVNNLSLADLTMNETEGKLISTISNFKQAENMEMNEGKLKLNGTFTPYERKDPFSL